MREFLSASMSPEQAQSGLSLLCSIVEALEESVLVADPNGLIRHVNAAFSRLAELESAEAGSRGTVDEIFVGRDRPPKIAEFADPSAVSWSGEARIRKADGCEFPVNARVDPVRDSAGALIGLTVVLTDLTQPKRVNEQLRMFESAVVHCLDPVLITEAEPIDQPGPRIVYANQAFTEVTGYTSEEVLGKTPRILQGPKSDRAELDKIREALTRWKPVKAELLNYRKDGSEFWVELAIFPVADDKGWYTHWVSVQRDITEKKSFEEELHSAKQEADRASQAKSSFLANMSHEIRTPLSAILGYSEILLNPLTEAIERDEGIRAIRRNGRHLLELVGGILDLSKIEAGKFVMDIIPYSPWRVALEVDSSQHVIAFEKHVHLRTRALGSLPTECMIDPTSVRQVLLNLVSNAIKFTPAEGKVVLSAEARRVPGSELGVELRFVVEDEGIGIDQEKAERLFQAFEQGDNSTSRKYGGTGLGLSISRKLTELMGGSISATSTVGKGSRFEVVIPCQLVNGAKPWVQPEDAEVPESPSSHDSVRSIQQIAPKHPGRVLLVDDNVDNRKILQHHLRPTGLVVELAENGREAIELAMAKPYDLIFLDMQMPEVDGYTAARQLRRSGYERPIIALTAHAMPEDRLKCLRAGCTDYLAKPVSVADLYSSLVRYLKADDRAAAEDHPLRPTVPLDDPVLVELTGEYVASLGDRLAELVAAFNAGDLNKCSSLAHSTKGAAGMYGYEILSKAASRIEQAIRENQKTADIAPLVTDFATLVRRIQRGLEL